MTQSATAFAPATIGNVGVGFDMLGLAIEGVGDRITATRTGGRGISIAEVRGLDGEPHPHLPTDAALNTASIAAQALWDASGDTGGVELFVRKGIPLQSGMGGSAASAVAGVVAVNALLERPLEAAALLPYALEGEKYASGGIHADNVAPCLLGGLVLCPPALLPGVISLPVPQGVSAVVMHPELQVSTADARRRLAKSYSMQQWLDQQGYLAGFVAACGAGDVELLRATLKDVIIEPQRADSVKCFADVKDAALRADAIGCSLSGSGPSIFCLVEDREARNAASAMEQACRALGIECQSWISSMQAPGAVLETG